MKKKFRNFTDLLDEYLQDPQFAADLLSESLEDQDLDTFLLSLKDVIRVHGSLKSIAEKAKINRGTLYNLFTADKANPEMKTIQAILGSLGYELRVARKISKKKTRQKKKQTKVTGARPKRNSKRILGAKSR